jgi:hypothetical protein
MGFVTVYMGVGSHFRGRRSDDTKLQKHVRVSDPSHHKQNRRGTSVPVRLRPVFVADETYTHSQAWRTPVPTFYWARLLQRDAILRTSVFGQERVGHYP